MATHERPARVAHEFQRELGAMLARGLKDPRITGFITVTGAKMSPDLKEVVAYVSIHAGEAERERTLEGLRAAATYLQREIAHRVHLRWTPHLRFVYDPSVAEGDKIERLLKQVKADDAHRAEEPPAAAAAGAEGEKPSE